MKKVRRCGSREAEAEKKRRGKTSSEEARGALNTQRDSVKYISSGPLSGSAHAYVCTCIPICQRASLLTESKEVPDSEGAGVAFICSFSHTPPV